MSQLRDLVAKLRLDTAPFKAGLQGARGDAAGLGAHIRAALLPVAGALTAAFSATALWQGVRQGAQEIDAVAKSARAVGGSIGGFRALELAAGESGVAVGTLREQVQNMDRQIAAGRADAALRALGFEAGKLAALDVDSRMATLADRIKELGLDTGSTLAILQQFGVENRDMALLMMQGGAAIRAARGDVESYGMALSKVDSAAVEQANDRIGRLSLVWQYLRQELATGVFPVLGELAQRFTDSLREGGYLREVIDTLTGALGNAATIVGAVVKGVMALGGALWDVASGFRDWLTNIPIVGSVFAKLLSPIASALDTMASMVRWFTDLIESTGGFGAALSALGTLAGGVWSGMKTSASALGPALNAVWATVKANFFSLLADLQTRWAGFLRRMTGWLPEVPEFSDIKLKLGTAAIDAQSGSYASAQDASNASLAADAMSAIARNRVAAGGQEAGQALQTLRDLVNTYRQSKEAGDGATESALRFNTALKGVAGGGAGGGAKGSADAASTAMKNLKDRVRELQQSMDQMKGMVGNAFVGFITGAKSFRQALGELAKMLANRAFQSIWSGGGGGGGLGSIFGALFGGLGGGGGGGGKWWLGGRSFDGGGHTGYGARVGGLDGRGGFAALLHPNETVIDHTRGQGAAGRVDVYVQPSGEFDTRVSGVAARVVQMARPGIVQESVGATYRLFREVKPQ